jgi:chaperonin GroES
MERRGGQTNHLRGQKRPGNGPPLQNFPEFFYDVSTSVIFSLTKGRDFCIFYTSKYTKFYKWRKNMKVKPLADRVMVKLEKNEAKSAGGLIIPDTAQEKTQTGTVVEVGDDKEVIKVKAGQKVMYDKYAGTQVKIDGVEHLILKMSDVIAVIE